jgi:hypothetical protein
MIPDIERVSNRLYLPDQQVDGTNATKDSTRASVLIKINDALGINEQMCDSKANRPHQQGHLVGANIALCMKSYETQSLHSGTSVCDSKPIALCTTAPGCRHYGSVCGSKIIAPCTILLVRASVPDTDLEEYFDEMGHSKMLDRQQTGMLPEILNGMGEDKKESACNCAEPTGYMYTSASVKRVTAISYCVVRIDTQIILSPTLNQLWGEIFADSYDWTSTLESRPRASGTPELIYMFKLSYGQHILQVQDFKDSLVFVEMEGRDGGDDQGGMMHERHEIDENHMSAKSDCPVSSFASEEYVPAARGRGVAGPRSLVTFLSSLRLLCPFKTSNEGEQAVRDGSRQEERSRARI